MRGIITARTDTQIPCVLMGGCHTMPESSCLQRLVRGDEECIARCKHVDHLRAKHSIPPVGYRKPKPVVIPAPSRQEIWEAKFCPCGQPVIGYKRQAERERRWERTDPICKACRAEEVLADKLALMLAYRRRKIEQMQAKLNLLVSDNSLTKVNQQKADLGQI